MTNDENETGGPGATSPRLGGLVLGSTDPRRLYDWYRAAFAPDAGQPSEPMLALELGGTWLIFEHRDDVGPKAAEPGRVLFNFEVDDIRAAEARLNELGVRWIRPVSKPSPDEPVLLATVEDPDGNFPQIVEVLSA
ncbi:VOC family protein [Streptomyces sp. NBC_01803]|uniref:VOC family protein n=1 Tax=Streptomyces sp. NBC_01803 TaxID=2975946 RepID=UPI002DD8A422|nr:VOC family protein [Streptomyces sp. NBC_01803]WSA44510.1 VOC family protein [Streptomyces sp. NBC_01803]